VCKRVCYILRRTDLRGKKEVIDGVQEGDKAHCGKRKAAKKEDTKVK
jgi:hypothetical protein